LERLLGKRALVTGGASGIGRATCELFAQEGASVTVVDIDEARGKETVQVIQAMGGKAYFLACDVSQPGQCREVVSKAVELMGGIDILFNNAGIIRRGTTLDLTESDWALSLAINLTSYFLFSKYSLPTMIASGGGVIVNNASAWGLVGGRQAVSYCASKGAVVNMSRAMALDHADQNIRVNCICPGDTDTAMLRQEARQLGQPEEAFLLQAADRPMGRIGRPEEIAQGVLFLASEASSYMTGAILVIDGGGLAD